MDDDDERRGDAPGGDTDARQQTSLDLTSVRYAGVEWQALRWRGAGHRISSN